MGNQLGGVSGGKALARALEKVPAKLAKRALGKALNFSATPVVRAARAAAPVRTGALRRNIRKEKWPSRVYPAVISIGVAHGKLQLDQADGAGVFKRRSGRLFVRKLSARERRREDPFYFRFQELGFTTRGGKRVPGRKFLSNAPRRAKSEATSRFGSRLKQEITKINFRER